LIFNKDTVVLDGAVHFNMYFDYGRTVTFKPFILFDLGIIHEYGALYFGNAHGVV
jgi:hypothetical protein